MLGVNVNVFDKLTYLFNFCLMCLIIHSALQCGKYGVWPEGIHDNDNCLNPTGYSGQGLPHVVKVWEDERLVDVKTACNDVFGILHGEAMALL